jgi:hypothetical protein
MDMIDRSHSFADSSMKTKSSVASSATLAVKGTAVAVLSRNNDDYLCITDIARHKDSERSDYVIQNWLRNRNTIEFLGVWERINNPDFNPIEFDGIKSRAGLNSFVITTRRWIESTRAIGLLATPGRYGGTFAHKDIAFEFASWVSVEFKLYLIKEFQRLKAEESRRHSSAWDLNRTLSKLNYRIHTDAVRTNLLPPIVTAAQAARTYASEADILNVALFGQTARPWREASPGLDGNIRDHASIQQLLVMANLESLNAELIQMGLCQGERLQKLNAAAIRQMHILTDSPAVAQLEGSRGSKAPRTAECRGPVAGVGVRTRCGGRGRRRRVPFVSRALASIQRSPSS